MTRNEEIAEKMGWGVFKTKSLGMVAKDQDGDSFPFMPESITADTPTGHWLSHLLTQRMVDDGWTIYFLQTKKWIKMQAEKGDKFHGVQSDDQPATIAELFCKVYGIPAGE